MDMTAYSPGCDQGTFIMKTITQVHPSLTLHLRFHSAGQKHTSKNFSAGGALAGEETQTINNYPEKYVAHI